MLGLGMVSEDNLRHRSDVDEAKQSVTFGRRQPLTVQQS